MSTLIAHSPRWNSKLVSIADLRAMPEPLALGPNHKPVPHIALVDGLLSQIDSRGFEVTRTRLALGHKGDALFGVIDLKGQHDDRSLALGFRNSVDRSMGIRAVAGTNVFVCDNMAMSGDVFAFRRKNTTGLDLRSMIADGFDKFLQHAEAFDLRVARLQGISLSADRAKAIVYDVFAASILPVKLFDDVNRYYFGADDTTPDCQPRTVWGVHNAFTRAMRELSPVRQFGASVELGRALAAIDVEYSLGTDGPAIAIDGPAVDQGIDYDTED